MPNSQSEQKSMWLFLKRAVEGKITNKSRLDEGSVARISHGSITISSNPWMPLMPMMAMRRNMFRSSCCLGPRLRLLLLLSRPGFHRWWTRIEVGREQECLVMYSQTSGTLFAGCFENRVFGLCGIKSAGNYCGSSLSLELGSEDFLPEEHHIVQWHALVPASINRSCACYNINQPITAKPDESIVCLTTHISHFQL